MRVMLPKNAKNTAITYAHTHTQRNKLKRDPETNTHSDIEQEEKHIEKMCERRNTHTQYKKKRWSQQETALELRIVTPFNFVVAIAAAAALQSHPFSLSQTHTHYAYIFWKSALLIDFEMECLVWDLYFFYVTLLFSLLYTFSFFLWLSYSAIGFDDTGDGDAKKK